MGVVDAVNLSGIRAVTMGSCQTEKFTVSKDINTVQLGQS